MIQNDTSWYDVRRYVESLVVYSREQYVDEIYCNTPQCCVTLYFIISYHLILYDITLCYTILHNMMYYITFSKYSRSINLTTLHSTPHYTTLHYTTLHYTMLHSLYQTYHISNHHTHITPTGHYYHVRRIGGLALTCYNRALENDPQNGPALLLRCLLPQHSLPSDGGTRTHIPGDGIEDLL